MRLNFLQILFESEIQIRLFRLVGRSGPWLFVFEPPHDKTNKMTVCPAKTQISLGICPVWSDFAVHMKKAWVLSYPLSAQRRLLIDWADAQADPSLRWAHSHFVGFVTRRLFCDKGIDWQRCRVMCPLPPLSTMNYLYIEYIFNENKLTCNSTCSFFMLCSYS